MAWAFVMVNLLDAPVVAAFARAAERCMAEFNAQHLANTALAFAKVGRSDLPLLKINVK